MFDKSLRFFSILSSTYVDETRLDLTIILRLSLSFEASRILTISITIQCPRERKREKETKSKLDISSRIPRTLVALHRDTREFELELIHRLSLRARGLGGAESQSADDGERIEGRGAAESTFSESSSELGGERGGEGVEDLLMKILEWVRG